VSERQRAPGVSAGPLWPAIVRIVLYVSVGTAVFAATFTVLTISAVVSRIARRCMWWWQLLGLRRRLMVAMVLSYLMGSVAVDTGLNLAQDVAALAAGGAGVALFGGWLWLDKRRGQREWERKKQSREGVLVVDGGADDGSHLDEMTARYAEMVQRVAALERWRDATHEGMVRAFTAAGRPVPDEMAAEAPTLTMLRVLDGGAEGA
jgi:hypothetical protein